MDPGLRRDDTANVVALFCLSFSLPQPQLPLLLATTLFTWLSV
jgi:hypothetical protein